MNNKGKLDKYILNDMLNHIPNDTDTMITFIRSLGDGFTFYNYDKFKLQLFDDYLVFHESENKQIKILYQNIIQVKWRQVFREKKMNKTVEADFKTKGGKKDG